MPSTSELRIALGRDGAARKQLQAVWGAWADDFCDSLLIRLPDMTGDYKIHIWGSQVNIDVGATGAYTVDTTDDPLKIIGERLAAELVCDTDTDENGDNG